MREIGEKLKKARLGKGLSLEDVHKATKIHLNILKAIEGEGPTNLSPVYLRAFIKNYSKFLGFDAKEFIPEHKEKTPMAAVPAEKAHTLDLKAPSIELSSIKPVKKLIKIFIYIIAGFIILAGLFNFGKFISLRHKGAVKVTGITQPLIPGSKKQKSKGVSASGGVRLSIIAKENCMVTLKVDGKMFFQGVLIRGRSESWKAKEKMELSLSNAGAVELIVNSQRFPNIGKKGQKLTNILINKEGLNAGR